jgi:CopG family nickel-responsive transcriptional regulator
MERFTISLDDALASEFDSLIARRGYANRSEAVRDLLRTELEDTKRREPLKGHCVACLSYVFNHHQRDLAERITGMQHDHHELTVSTMHAHLDHDHCLETVILKGEAKDVQLFADALCAERGVHHGHVNMISVQTHEPHGRKLPKPTHVHGAGGHPHLHLKPVR